ncbi:MAG: hypothetical protein QXT19_01870 [Candidatus Woesearchaeota archaeon]
MPYNNQQLSRETQRQILKEVWSNKFEHRTGIPPWSFVTVSHNSQYHASLFFTPVALEERVKEWCQKLTREHGIHFRYEILDFDSYCRVFQSGFAGRSPETLPLLHYVHDHRREIFGTDDVYPSVQFLEAGRVITEVDFVAPGMLVKVDEPLRQKRNRSQHRKRKHNSLHRACDFIEQHDYGHCRRVRLEGIPLGWDEWEIALFDVARKNPEEK